MRQAWLKATIGYVPDKSFIGYSKMTKMSSHFACRYTMDERLCNDFLGEFRSAVEPRGVDILRGKHFCVISRGGLESDFATVSGSVGRIEGRLSAAKRVLPARIFVMAGRCLRPGEAEVAPRTLGIAFLSLGVVVLCAALPVWELASGNLNEVAGWANVLAFPVTVFGLFLTVVSSRPARGSTDQQSAGAMRRPWMAPGLSVWWSDPKLVVSL